MSSIYKLIKPLLLLMLCLPMLSCDRLFDDRPKTMTIEYDEEVKLHDGEMIWVHITRHYFLAGEIPHGSGYMPGDVEISWDTGFEGIGRKTLAFRNVTSIEKINNDWYVFGGVIHGNPSLTNYHCKIHGLITGKQKSGCLIGVNQSNNFFIPELNNLFKMNPNVLYPVQIKDWGELPNPLNGKEVSWIEKLNLQKSQPEEYRFITNENYTQEQFK